jgi:hypothetical protein
MVQHFGDGWVMVKVRYDNCPLAEYKTVPQLNSSNEFLTLGLSSGVIERASMIHVYEHTR